MAVVWIQIFKAKVKAPCKCLSVIMPDSVIKSKKKKVLSSNTFRRMQIWTKKIKVENLIDHD